MQKSMAIQPVIASSLNFNDMSATEISTMMTVMQKQLTLLSENNTPSLASDVTAAIGDSPATAPSQQVDRVMPTEIQPGALEPLPTSDKVIADISMMEDDVTAACFMLALCSNVFMIGSMK